MSKDPLPLEPGPPGFTPGAAAAARFIVFEGIDGAGTTTQLQRLVATLAAMALSTNVIEWGALRLVAGIAGTEVQFERTVAFMQRPGHRQQRSHPDTAGQQHDGDRGAPLTGAQQIDKGGGERPPRKASRGSRPRPSRPAIAASSNLPPQPPLGRVCSRSVLS